MKTKQRNNQRRPRASLLITLTVILLSCSQQSLAQWSPGGDNIFNSNPGNVGVGTNSPSVKLEVVSPSILIAKFGSTAPWNSQVLIDAHPQFNSNLTLQRGGVSKWYLGNRASNDRFSFIEAQGETERLALLQNGNLGVGTISPGERLVTFGNMLVGNINSHTQLYPGYDSQSNMIMEIGYGTASPNITPLSSLVLSKNLTSTNNAIGVISFANSNITNGNEKRLSGIATFTDGALNSGTLQFYTSTAGTFTEQMRITSGGNVGIGTPSPTEKLEVIGNVKVSGNINAKYQDLAEWVESSEELSAGTVVIVDSSRSNHVIASTQSYDSRVAGVISQQPGLTLGEAAEGSVLVATTGRVKVKVDATNGPIQIGDLLVSSDREGFAMKSLPVGINGVQMHRPGTLIGKALEPLTKGTGEILVLLSLQ